MSSIIIIISVIRYLLDDWVAGYVNQAAMKTAKKIKEVRI